MLARKALAGTAGAAKEYVEDVFSSYLYVGNDSTQTITNEIDLAGEGGLIWLKKRNATSIHGLWDTERGGTKRLNTSASDAESTLTAFTFNSNGFTIPEGGSSYLNESSSNRYISWTFRKAKKFFDVVTYTGNGTTQAISHNLGSAPGSVWVKSTSAGGTNWFVWHRSLTSGYYIYLNTTGAQTNANNTITFGNNTTTVDPTSTNFTIGSNGNINDSGQSYVAYLFAHDAGGFGDAGSDSIIKCGSYTGTRVDLGWEPQWIMYKRSDSTGNWVIVDNMRGVTSEGNNAMNYVLANTSGAEVASSGTFIDATGWGFTGGGAGATTYIYIAIRKGPMKTPETGTSVFTPTAFSGNDTSGTRSAGLNAFDLLIAKRTASSSLDWVWLDKLRGLSGSTWLTSNATTAEGGGDIINTINGQYTQDGINITKTSNYSYLDAGSSNYVWYALKRTPGFFDEVCWTGTGSNIDVTHSLGVTPEFIIGKQRDYSGGWIVYHKDIGSTGGYPNYMVLNSTQASGSGASTIWRGVSSTTFSYGTNSTLNINGINNVAYLFASVSGVSKVGSYTGNGSSQTINCGFTNGARFILIKRTDNTGDWYTYDTARGIVSGNDSQLKLNTDAVAATGYDAVDPDNSGFIVNNDATNFPINVNGATYIYLAIA